MSDALLTHIRVIELSSATATNLACQFLAEAGADVIKVEAPGGDPRRAEPGFAVWNRSKRSVVLNLDDHAQRDQLSALLETADLFIHDLTPQQSQGLGLDEAALQKQHPALISVNISGMPVGHPDDEMPCVDSLVLAEGGFFDYLEPVRRESGPVYLRFPLGTHCAAYLAAVGAVARLRARDQGAGVGSVRTSLLQGAMVPLLMLCHRAEKPTQGVKPPPKNPINQLVECSDGVWLHLMSPCDHAPSVKAAIEKLDPALRQRENAKLPYYMQHMPSFMLYPLIFKERPSKEWLAELWTHDVAVDAAAPLGQLYFDEQARLNGYVVEVDDPTWGRTLQPGSPLAIDPPPGIKWPMRPAGADTEAVLAELEAMPRRCAASSGASLEQPLAGLRVLDIGNFLAGPLATELLAELGATVIKLEATSGDPMRWAEWAFCGAQRGKRCIAADLKNPGARSIIERLVRWADVVHHNLRMPAAEKLGLGYDALRAINPAIIYSHVNAYGPKGPRSGWPGFDQMMQSAAGWERECAGEGNAPAWVRFGMTDHICALSSLLATVLALYQRDRTGQGQSVSASLLGATAITQGETLARPDGEILPYPRLDADQTGVSPRQRIYRCADGWLSLFAPDEAGYDQLLEDVDATSTAALEAYFGKQPVNAAIARCRAYGIYAVSVRTEAGDGVFLDEEIFRRLGLVHTYTHPIYGNFEMLGQYWHFGGMKPKLDMPPPTLGQHTSELLHELGFGPEEIAAMKAARVVVETNSMSASLAGNG